MTTCADCNAPLDSPRAEFGPPNEPPRCFACWQAEIEPNPARDLARKLDALPTDLRKIADEHHLGDSKDLDCLIGEARGLVNAHRGEANFDRENAAIADGNAADLQLLIAHLEKPQ